MGECFKGIWADAAHSKTHSFKIHSRLNFKKKTEFPFIELVKVFCFSVCCNWIGQPVAPLIAGVITPEHVDWYTIQGRAIGIQVDLNCSSIFNGKLKLPATRRNLRG